MKLSIQQLAAIEKRGQATTEETTLLLEELRERVTSEASRDLVRNVLRCPTCRALLVEHAADVDAFPVVPFNEALFAAQSAFTEMVNHQAIGDGDRGAEHVAKYTAARHALDVALFRATQGAG